MAHNSRTRPDWITGAIPTEAEFDDLDQKTFEALNGDQGGTWAPASRIHLGGAGLQMDANLLINRAVDLNGDGLGFRGKIVERVATLPDGNLVFPLVGSDFGFIGRVTSAVTGTRTYDLGAATSGDTVTFLCIGFAGSVTIRDQALATLFSLGQGDAHDGDYSDTPPRLHQVARRSLHAHLLKLAHDGRVVEQGERWKLLA